MAIKKAPRPLVGTEAAIPRFHSVLSLSGSNGAGPDKDTKPPKGGSPCLLSVLSEKRVHFHRSLHQKRLQPTALSLCCGFYRILFPFAAFEYYCMQS